MKKFIMRSVFLGFIFGLVFTIRLLPVSAALGNITNVTQSGDTFTITIGSDIMTVQVCKPELVKVNFKPGGNTSSDTLILDPNKTWGTGNITSADTTSNPMTISTSKMVIKINKTPCRISIYDTANNLLLKEQDAEGVYNDGVKFNHTSGENFYGIGGFDAWEDSSILIQRNSGGVVHANQQGDCGAPLTFTKKYGVLVDSNGGNFTIDSSQLNFTNVSKTDIEYFVIVAEPKGIMQDVAEISGKPAMFPKWVMGFSNFQWGSSESEVTNIISTYRSKQIPIDCFVLDYDWKAWGEDNYGESRWNSTNNLGNQSPNLFPNGASGAFANTMTQQGIKLGGILKPRIMKYLPDNTTLTAQGSYAQSSNFWIPGQADYKDGNNRTLNDLDFSNANCRTWFFDHLKDSFDKGIVGWWNDEADTIQDAQLNNFQFLNMQRAMYDGQRAYSTKRVLSWNRDFYLGAQRYSYGLWSGDIHTGFPAMKQQRERMLASINTGSMKWGMDCGGFSADPANNSTHPSNENYARWIQFGSFVPVFRVHGWVGEKRQPWVYGTIAEAAAKNAIDLRYRLIPYIYSYERKATETGLGLVWPLFYEFPNDTNVVNRVDAWMFGDWLMAAPVVDQGQSSKSIYLPAGTWYDYFKGNQYTGGTTINYSLNTTTWEDSPLFIRKGAIIPSQEVLNYIGEKNVAKVYVDVFADTTATSFTYYDDDGTTYGYEGGTYFKQAMTAQDNGASGISFNIGAKSGSYAPPLQYYIVKIHGKIGSSVTVNGTALTKSTDKIALENASSESWATGTDVYGNVTYVKVAASQAKNIVVNGSGTPDKSIYEAEDAILQEQTSIIENHTGYSGAGFVEGYWNQNATTKFSIRVPAAGSYSVALHFANATGSSKTVSIYVNGAKIKQTTLANLANWDTWSDQAETLTLTSGLNTISYKYDTGDSGNINLDYISLTVGSAPTPTPTTSPTPTKTPTTTPGITPTPSPTATPTPTPVSFNDNFNDNLISSAWTFYGSGTWTEQGTILRQDSISQGDPCKATLSNSGKTFGSNHTVLAKVYVDAWTDGDSARAGVSLFTGTGDGKGYNLIFHNNHSTVQFLDDGTAWSSVYTFNWTNQTWYWFKLKMENGTLYGKVWQDGVAEPGNWPYTWTRSGRSGYPALNGGTSGHGGSCKVFFDDVTVTVP